MPDLVLGESLEVLIDHRGKTPKKLGGDFTPRGIPIASAMLVQDGRLRLDEGRFVSPEMYLRWMSVPTRRHDVLLTSEAPLGRVALVPDDNPLVLGQRLFGLRGKRGVLDSRFLFYALQTETVQGELQGRASGTTVAGIRQSELVKVKISVPNYPEQRAIAAILGSIDDKIAVNYRIVSETLALGDACFIMARSSAPCRSTLAELAAEKKLIFGDGYRTKRSELGQPGLPILRVAEVMNGRIKPQLTDFVADTYRATMGGKVSQAGDVILTSKGTVGRVAVTTANDPSFVYSPQLCYFRVPADSPLTSSYIYFWLRSIDFWQQAETRKSQTDMADYLSLTDVRTLTIPMPTSGSNQQRSPTLSSLLAQISASHEENSALAELRDTLLPKLISGQIRVRDAEKVVEDVT